MTVCRAANIFFRNVKKVNGQKNICTKSFSTENVRKQKKYFWGYTLKMKRKLH